MTQQPRKKRAKKRNRSSAKGGSFERMICKALSLWVTEGKSQDVFWRTAMSGGRATVMARKDVRIRQAGDICAVSQEGHEFTDEWFVECKHRKNMELRPFLFLNRGPLAKFWKKTCEQARANDDRKPMLIFRQNGLPILVVTKPAVLSRHLDPLLTSYSRDCDISLFNTMVHPYGEKKRKK